MHTQVATLAQNSGDAGGLIVLFVYLALIVLVIAGFWKTFQKAGQPGWAAIIPIYNLYILTKVAGRPWWWLILCFIPIVSIIIIAILSFDIAKAFGKGALFGVGLWLLGPIFYCILGFGSAQYQGPPARA
jgi:hypothetical protein